MSYIITIAPEALARISAAAARYIEYHPTRDIDDHVTEIFRQLRALANNPHINQVVEVSDAVGSAYRRITIWKYHYYYTTDDAGSRIVVAGVFHVAGDPEERDLP